MPNVGGNAKKMRRSLKYIVTLVGLLSFLSLWFWADSNDYFQTKYKDLTFEQEKIFAWRSDVEYFDLIKVYQKYFSDTNYKFPRQNVSKIVCFKNILMFGAFTSKTLKQEYNNQFINFCNDSSNFHWKETTWELKEAEYYFRLFDHNNKTVGKIYFCLKNCGMTKSRPFCPTMKFGGLTNIGRKQIEDLIANKRNWE